MGNHHCRKNRNLICDLKEAFSNGEIYGYPISNLALMPPGTDILLILKAMSKIVKENKCINGIENTKFTGTQLYSSGIPYMELLIPDSNSEDFYVYSTTNNKGYMFTNDASLIEKRNPRAIENSFRFYMWDTTIFNLAVNPTDDFPEKKFFKYKNGNGLPVQEMFLKAKTIAAQEEPYTTKEIIRNTIYIYYPNSAIYCLVDTINNRIYAMQTGNNQKTGTTPLTPENIMYTQQLITLPPGFLFLCTQLSGSETVLCVSSPGSPAVLMQDTIGNSYQLTDPFFAKPLYDSYKNLFVK